MAHLTRVGLILYATALALSFYNGSAIIDGDGWRGFVQKLNWFLYFLIFPLIGALTVTNWASFRNAWLRLPAKDVLLEMSSGGLVPLSPDGVQGIDDELRRLRKWCVGFAIAIGLLLTSVDGACTATFHFPSLYDRLPTYMQEECTRDPEKADKKKFSRRSYTTAAADGQNKTVELRAENDFSILHLNIRRKTVSTRDLPGTKYAGAALVLVIHSMQATLIAIQFVLLLQIFINLYVFSLLALRPFRHGTAPGIRLNFEDKMAEFGLADWNNAINYTNVVIAIAMAIPVISAQSQPEGRDDVGQVLLMVILPLFFFIPILWLFMTRVVLQLRFKRDFHHLSESEKNSYKDQALWPFDRDVISKVTIGIIAAEYFFIASELPKSAKAIFSLFGFK